MAAFPFPYTFFLTKPSISKSLTTRHHVKLLVSPTTRKNTSKTCSCSAQNTRRAPSNSPLWTVTDIAQAVGGKIVKWGPPGTISIDTRTIEPGQWFFAITGENVDAHDFITLDLSKSGCVGVIGNRVCENWEMGFVQVDGDTVSSLLKMAAFARNRFVGKVIAVTGSVGKTSTKAMIALALESLGSKVYHSYEHWNNTFGVSLSLITIPRDAGIAVLEMGMNRKGQLLELTRLGRPDIRVILKVATAHLENLVSLEGVAMAKGEMFQEAKPGDICVANADDPFVKSIPVPQGARRVLFGRSLESDVRLVAAERVGSGGSVGVRVVLQKNMEMVEFVIPTLGLHMAVNACAAAAVATSMGVPLSQVGRSLSRYIPVSMRSEFVVAKSGIKIVNDAFNANPVSTKAGIDTLKNIDCDGKRVAILGDMFELGTHEIEYHEEVLNYCLDACIDVVAIAGQRFHLAADNMNLMKKMKVVHAVETENLIPKILNCLNMNDVVLVKGGCQMQMVKVVDAIKAMPRFTQPSCSGSEN
ncbi:uncharacterized protein LOC108476520 [Gossypium arboreum]|uniref:UDP-MurNAc-pentapeptide synthetase n=1 Tax=Gossypium arboreum TaxID=29729 RepID=A0ABR0MR20_GOSAR|nr:uncharacterized protein LOC108476520 [Gossypium arboreum]KAK5776436.1 hypothetical protein PVK06_044395 [Gossypium arboreum]